jgi:hypothetical protein
LDRLRTGAAARTLGRTTVIDPLPTPPYHVLGAEIGVLSARRHRDHGVDLCSEDGVEDFLGAGSVETVRKRVARRSFGTLFQSYSGKRLVPSSCTCTCMSTRFSSWPSFTCPRLAPAMAGRPAGGFDR